MSDFTPILKESYKKKKIQRYANGGAIPMDYEAPQKFAEGADVIPTVDVAPEGSTPYQSPESESLSPSISPNDEIQAVDAAPEGSIPFEGANEEKYGTAEQMAKTGLEGISKGILGSTITAGAERLAGVNPEDIRGREATNPGIAGASELAGFAGSAFLPFGQAGVLTKAGEAAAHAAAISSKIGQAAIKGATEFGLMGADDAISKLIKEDPEASAQSALVGTGLSAAIGLVAGPTLAKATELGGMALSKGAELLKSASESRSATFAKQAIADAVGTVRAGTHAGEAHELAKDELEGLWGQMQGAHAVVDGEMGIKREALGKLLGDKTTDVMHGQFEDATKKLQDAADKMEANPELYPPHIAANMRDRLARLDALEAQSKSPSELFHAIQELKGDMQKSGSILSRMNDSDPAYRAVKMTQDLGREFRGMLEDQEVWGKAGKLQQEYNAVAAPMIGASKNFQKYFMSKLPSGEKVFNDNAIAKFVKQAQDPKGSIQRKVLQDFSDINMKYQSEADKLHAAAGIDREATIPTSMAYLNKLAEQTTPGQRLGKSILDSSGKSGELAGAAIGAHALGSVLPGYGHVIGAKVGQEVLGPILDSMLKGLKASPAGEKVSSMVGAMFDKFASQAPSGEALKAALEHTMAVAKGQSIMDKSAKALFKKGALEATSSYMPSDKDLNDLKKKLAYMRSAPTDGPLIAMDGDKHLAHYMPDQAAAKAGSAYAAEQMLKGSKPNNDPKAPLDTKLPVSKVEQAKYNNQLRLMQQPNYIMDKLHNGSITPQDVQIIRSVYPGYYNQMSQKITREMISAQHKGILIPFQLKQGLTVFMGQPMESAMTQASIAAAQATHATPQNRPQEPGKAGAALNASGKQVHAVDKLAAQYKTPEQARDTRANKK